MIKLNIALFLFAVIGVVISGCNHQEPTEPIKQNSFSPNEKLIIMLITYDSIYSTRGNDDYDYAVCASPWPSSFVCITGVLDEHVTRDYLIRMEYNGKNVYLITGFEPLVNKNTVGYIENELSSVYDPPTLCYEWIDTDNYEFCDDRFKCWHCKNPPPPPTEPTVRYRKPNN